MRKTISIRFKSDKNGCPRAHYWGAARRWLPISIEKAELWLATGKAVMTESTSDPLPPNYVYSSVDGDIFDRA